MTKKDAILHLSIVENAISMISLEQAFLHVVEAGSFKKAAELLGTDSSSLSRKVAALEARLQVKLLQRSTARSVPTEMGQTYYKGLRKLISEQSALEEEITGGSASVRGRLRVSATVDFGERFLVPAIQQIQSQAPDLSVELLLGSDVDNLLEKNLDVAFRFGPLADSSLYARQVGNIPRVLVASPAYLERMGTPRCIDDLKSHLFVLYSLSQARVDIAFEDGRLFSHQGIHSNVAANSLRAIRPLVIGGAGIHWGPRWLYQVDLDSGNVVELLPEHPVVGFSIFAVYTARDYLPQKTRLFIDCVVEQLSALND
ncbi:LysR family transcriptional regulator [Enterovibrio sp. ZSDZ35]|uniref:LysR family transcriptional regulator n=1 Tax=Enterovibrio qingdaonensis TaxID=2899818 RepID=A0ABT5QJ86_9GAMM|nr:LysR family transcriptional regulator [Enterovibrio sp. ZSDZ35]MDD1781055.1 LysR family transcriptional regulator [Enterovibrio sp. ZSDZ35]